MKKELTRASRIKAKDSVLPTVWPRRKSDWLIEVRCCKCDQLVGFGPKEYYGRGFVCDFCELQMRGKNYDKGLEDKR